MTTGMENPKPIVSRRHQEAATQSIRPVAKPSRMKLGERMSNERDYRRSEWILIRLTGRQLRLDDGQPPVRCLQTSERSSWRTAIGMV